MNILQVSFSSGIAFILGHFCNDITQVPCFFNPRYLKYCFSISSRLKALSAHERVVEFFAHLCNFLKGGCLYL